jgi:hypothetical protein
MATASRIEPPDRDLPFRWLVEMGNSLDAYQFRWIVVDPEKIENNWGRLTDIIVADADTLGDAMVITEARDISLDGLFYVFIRPRSSPVSR